MKTITTKNGKFYTKKQICEAIEYWKKLLKKLDESEDEFEFEVKAISNDGTEIDETIDAKDLYELVSFVKEDFARESGIDIDDVRFSFDEVIDENGNDVTNKANACIDFK